MHPQSNVSRPAVGFAWLGVFPVKRIGLTFPTRLHSLPESFPNRSRGTGAGFHVRTGIHSLPVKGAPVAMTHHAFINPKSLSENCKGCCCEGFWLWPRRRGSRIPAVGCNDRVNAGQRQKTRRPEGFRAAGRLASLLLSRRPTRGILLRRVSLSGLLRENSTPWNFQTDSKASRLRRVAASPPEHVCFFNTKGTSWRT